jgi:hypothetical protein
MKISRLEMLTFHAQLTAQVPLMLSLWRVEFRYCCRLGGHDRCAFVILLCITVYVFVSVVRARERKRERESENTAARGGGWEQ